MKKEALENNNHFNLYLENLKKDIKTYNLKKSDINLFLNIKRALKKLNIENSDILKHAWENRGDVNLSSSENDIYHLVVKSSLGEEGIIKKAYPSRENYFFENRFVGYDLKKWADCVHKIYESVYKEGIEYPNAVEKYSNNIFDDEEEKFNFLRWLKYYNKGEHLKYNIKTASLSKRAVFDVSLSATGNAYSSGYNYIQPESSLNHDNQMNDAREHGEKKVNYKNWKKKFNTALRRVDKILKESEEYIDPEKYEEISEVLHKLDVQISKVRLQVSASDISYRAAASLKKLGFDPGANILYKYAQEADPTPAATQPEAPKPESAEVAQPAAAPSAEKQQEKENIEKGRELVKGIDPVPGPAEDEYEDIMKDDVSIDDASRKLEQIAGTLSDRRVIRYLAEFDIILDKVGIASMFPELAEAQSKLIESYSYALTRVTKMLGMLSNNRNLLEMAKEEAIKELSSQPGQPTAPQTQAQPAAPQTQETE